MEERYKNCLIRATGVMIPDSFQWRATAEISWIETGKEWRRHLLSCDIGRHETERLAEIEGLLLARQWIDSREL